MRVISGRLRGKKLNSPTTSDIRPTSDRARENIFNILAHRYENICANARVLDIYAGSGAMGIEALSRGAHFALFVDISVGARALIRQNLDECKLGGQSKIFNRDATDLGQPKGMDSFDLVFIDPPYAQGLTEPTLFQLIHMGWLKANALIVVEEQKGLMEQFPDGYEIDHQMQIGKAGFHFLKIKAQNA